MNEQLDRRQSIRASRDLFEDDEYQVRIIASNEAAKSYYEVLHLAVKFDHQLFKLGSLYYKSPDCRTAECSNHEAAVSRTEEELDTAIVELLGAFRRDMGAR